MEASPRVECITCPTCGSRKTGAIWQDSPVSREELTRELAIQAVRLIPEARDAEFQVTSRERSPNRTIAKVRVKANVFGVPVEDEAEVEVVWRGETCDRCSRISGGYFEGVVQVRAAGRALSPREQEVATRIACEVEERLQEGGARLSFISRMTEEEGLDIVVGQSRMGERIAQEITGALGGRYTVHPKLTGEKDGKRLYRITYSIRLPRLQKGDVVEVDGEYPGGAGDREAAAEGLSPGHRFHDHPPPIFHLPAHREREGRCTRPRGLHRGRDGGYPRPRDLCDPGGADARLGEDRGRFPGQGAPRQARGPHRRRGVRDAGQECQAL